MITGAIVVSPPAGTGAVGAAPIAGPTGPSAYQVAVALGFTGTVQQWLASLVGPAATSAQVQSATQALLGQPSGIAQLDPSGRQPVAQDQIRAWQVARAAKPALAAVGGSWSDLVATLAANTDALDGSYEAVQGGAPAPPTGVLSKLLSTYLVTSCGQSAAQAQAALASIWLAAAAIQP